MILWSESGSPLFILKRNNIGFGEIGHKLRRERRKEGRKEGRKGALETADITWTDAADITLARAREWAADGRGTAGKKSLQ